MLHSISWKLFIDVSGQIFRYFKGQSAQELLDPWRWVG